jgi:phosphoribosylformylglycinamidine synthase
MILFFSNTETIYAVHFSSEPSGGEIQKLEWLFGNARLINQQTIAGFFVGPRREMITPWSTNAVEITQIMGIIGILRIEEFRVADSAAAKHDPMLERVYDSLGQDIFLIGKQPDPVMEIENIAAYNQQEGLALSEEEVNYLNEVSKKIGRKLTDGEVFGFSQVNSEHCRHKIFNGAFIIDGTEKPDSLFGLIRNTSSINPGQIVSAYKDNVAFINGPGVEQFAPVQQNKPDYFEVKDVDTVISLKAETHNFPTTVEPFNGAATGSGGEIRDRMAGGKGSMPIAGTAVYMTSYPRPVSNRGWESKIPPRPWLYQTPEEILIKASNGASDFGNKFGQPLICGSVLTFEHMEPSVKYGYDKVIMLAGGIGYGRKSDSLKGHPAKGDKVVVMGGDNYRIGMGGGAVSSVATGEYHSGIELNAIQRSNPEMQKRVYNAIRAMAESDNNPVISVHDHGAGGHLNSLSELVEEQGGYIDLSKLPVGDPTLSAKEIIGNESQERMGLVVHPENLALLEEVAGRERAPIYIAGQITGDMNFTFEHPVSGEKPLNLKLEYLFGKPPRTIIRDESKQQEFAPVQYDPALFLSYLRNVLQMEAVACKDWLTNKVDRSVTGRIALQQCAGPLQLPLNNCGVVALDFQGVKGIATSLGHAPVSGLVNASKGSRLSIAEALTNIVWAPLSYGLSGISLSANWMWPCKNSGEDARLYEAVEAASDFAIQLGINIPTGKDSLSMTQKYPDGSSVMAPGTVIITAVSEVSDIRKSVTPVLQPSFTSSVIYIDFSNGKPELGGSSFAQSLNMVGNSVPDTANPAYFIKAFNAVQSLIQNGIVLSGHDIGSGGRITSLLEMTFSVPGIGLRINIDGWEGLDLVEKLFAENPGVIIQVNDLDYTTIFLHEQGIRYHVLGTPVPDRTLFIEHANELLKLDIDSLRDDWFRTSFLLDQHQSGALKASERFGNYKLQSRDYRFHPEFNGTFKQFGIDPSRRQKSGIRAAIIREKGSNGDREMAWSLYLAGFDVKDVHMTDLVTGRETLEDVNMIVFVGGFSNSDVLGSAKGWAGAFLFNEKAKQTLLNFYARKDTLSLGVCNGCQLLIELGLLNPGDEKKPAMLHNDTHKYESSFLTIDILENKSIMLSTLAGSSLGIWVAHGDGKFWFPYEESRYQIPAKYCYSDFPGNPNGSMFNAACLTSDDGRHLAIMPHLERSVFPWQWGNYPSERKNDEVTPWIEAFVNAREWIWNQL